MVLIQPPNSVTSSRREYHYTHSVFIAARVAKPYLRDRCLSLRYFKITSWRSFRKAQRNVTYLFLSMTLKKRVCQRTYI